MFLLMLAVEQKYPVMCDFICNGVHVSLWKTEKKNKKKNNKKKNIQSKNKTMEYARLSSQCIWLNLCNLFNTFIYM